jgi:energy-coupling factor transporter ATP-binding protein EcfA2
MIDEITNGLDEENKNWIKSNLIEQKQKGKTILVISHDWDWLVGLIDRVLHFENGKIISEMDENQFISFRDNQLKQIENY